MQFRFINGQLMHFTTRELLALFRHPASITTLLVASALIVWIRPYDALADVNSAQLVAYWGLMLPVAFLAYLGVLLLLARCFAVAYSFLAHVVAALVCVLLAPLIQWPLGIPRAPWPEMVQAYAFTLVCTLAIELFMVTYLARRISPRAPPAEPLPSSSPVAADDRPRVVVLLGKPYDQTELRLISAEEHYVRIHTRSRQDLLRGRISDIEAQLPADLGLRVHRSHWVAAVAVRQLQRRSSGWVLLTCLGIEVPVARARREAVRDWLDGTEITDTD